MPGIKISQLPEPSTNNTAQIAATDVLPIARSGTTQGITGAAFINALSAVGNGTSLVGTRTFDINSGVTLNVNSLSGVSPVNITTNNGTVSLNVNNLVTDVNSIASNVATISSTFVKQICAGAGISISPLNGQGIVTVSLAPVTTLFAPPWYIGQTNNLLFNEVGTNRVSQQISNASQFTNYLLSVVAANTAIPVMPYAISVSEPGGQGRVTGEGAIVLGDGNVYTFGGYVVSTKSGLGYLSCGQAGQSGGGCLIPDGRIFIVPTDGSSAAYIINPYNGTRITCGGSYWNKTFYNAALLSDGRVYVNPIGSGVKATIYDPVTNTTTESSNAPTGASRTCVGLRDGRVYRIPGGHSTDGSPGTTAFIYNPATNSFTAAGGTLPTTNQGWFGGRLTAEGRVVCAPNNSNSTGALIYDPVGNTHTTSGVLGWYNSAPSNVLNYSGGTLLPNGSLFFPPYSNAPYGIIYNPYSNTTIQVTLISNGSTGGYGGCALLSNGDVYIAGQDNADRILSFQFSKNFDINTITSPYFQHGSY